jgi:4-amino-4-deoxy-L-arabinose transferase-like glycosyltransferase
MFRQKHERFLYAALLFVTVIPLFFLGLSNHGLWSADEPRVAEIGREMALTGNWAVPMLDQKPFLEEPPLYYAALATVFKAAGNASDKIVRLPSTIFAIGGVIALFFLGSMLFGPRVGFISGLILATGAEYFRVAHWVIVDSALTCFIMSAMALFMAGYVAEGKGKKLLFYALCYVACGFAFFSKGFIGIAIPGLAVLAFLVFDKNLKELLKMHLWLGILICIAMALPWFLALWQQGGGDYLRIFLVHNHLQRFAPGGSSGHNHPFYYYLTEFPAGFLPWSLLLVPVLYRSFSRSGDLSDRPGKGVLFAKCWFLTGFIFLSIASTKRVLYLMPIFAPISLLTACYIDTTLARMSFKTFEKIFVWLFGLLPLFCGLAAMPAYFYLSKIYGLGFPARETSWIIAVAVLAAGLSLAALRFLKRGNAEKFWMCASASIYSLLILGLVAVIPLVDRHKSFVPFCREIIAMVPAGSTLYAYQPDETLRGAVPFYTGRYLEEIETLPAIEEILKKDDAAFVIVRDSRGKLEKELLSTGRPVVLVKQEMGTNRSLLLLSNRDQKISKTAAKLMPVTGGGELP